jgi:hypothetical protein
MKQITRNFYLFLASFLLTVSLLAGSFNLAQAQAGYSIHVNRDFGFGNGSQIRGTFSLSLVGDEANVASVEYQIDGQKLAIASQAPFKVQFNTNSYPSAVHELGAVVTLKDGSTVTTETYRYQFVSAAEESAAMQNILIPLLAVVFGLIVLMLGIQLLAARGKPAGGPEPGTQRSYGFAGGSICPKCKRPTPLHPMGFNIGLGKFDRCENCGKWSVMRRYPMDQLRAAEIAEMSSERVSIAAGEKSEEEKLREMLDESRYTKS